MPARSLTEIPSQPGFVRRFGPYFVMPVIAGLEDDGSVYLSGMDSLGAIETAKDFIVAGSAPDSLSGMCESMFRPDMVRTLVYEAHAAGQVF